MKKILILPAVVLSAVALASCGGVKEKKYSNKVDEAEFSEKFEEASMEVVSLISEKKDFVVEFYSEKIDTDEVYGQKSKATIKEEETIMYDNDNEIIYTKSSSQRKESTKENKNDYKYKDENVIQKDGDKVYSIDLIAGTYTESFSMGSVLPGYIFSDDYGYETDEVEYYYDIDGDSKIFTLVYKMPEKYEGESIVQYVVEPTSIQMYVYYDVKVDYNVVDVKGFNFETGEVETKHYDYVKNTKCKTTSKISFENVELDKEDVSNYIKA